ncbi:MAG: response regulator [Kiritimatiellae bacterium]|nr:response regulator [Kiritimatiellia bacterium]
MKKSAHEQYEELSSQSAVKRALHSIRTRYSLATAFLILLCLAVFYIGGRIVLVHMMREAERQVEEIGYDMSRLAYSHADMVVKENRNNAAEIARLVAKGEDVSTVLSRPEFAKISLVLAFSGSGEFASGAARGADGILAVSASEVAPYAERFSEWLDPGSVKHTPSVGLVQLCGRAHYVFVVPSAKDSVSRVVVGAPFDSAVFTSSVNDGFSGLDVRVVNRKVAVTVSLTSSAKAAQRASEGTTGFGIVPMLSEAISFYSGGFWNLGSNPYEAVFALRDIAGNAVSMISVSLPTSLSTVTRSALGRFTFFISMVGIVLILPIFWFQGRVLLNPLTKMTEAIRDLGEHHEDIDCPSIDWEGNDEFAMLALSVNRMLETITERTVKIAQVEARHRALIDGLPDALAVFDRRGRLVAVNKQPEGTPPLPGMVRGETPSAEVFGEDGSKAIAKAIATVFETPSVQAVRLESRGDEPRHFEVRITRMDEVFALAIVRDVTREAAEHKLRLAAEARSLDASKRESLTLLAAGIAHDVNNVLSVILSTVESAAADSGSGLDIVAIRDAVMRGSRMTKELMAFAGDNKVSLLRASPEFFVKDIQALASHVVSGNVAISYTLAEGLPDVDADPNQFWKVFFNIIKNATEALGERPGHIAISTEAFEMTEEAATLFTSEHPIPPGPGVVFKIADDGPGIPADILPKLFDPYVSSKTLGRGLGLATVRTIVEGHGGGIKVESVIDHGTTFSIFLPQTKLPKDSQGVASAQEKTPGSLPSEVLVVDDDEAILKTLSILLKSLGVSAYVARDRISALAVIRRYTSRIGAVLMDAHMGSVDVVRLFDALRLASPDIPVVIVSGSPEDEISKMFAGQSYNGFLSKPFTVKELKATLMDVYR